MILPTYLLKQLSKQSDITILVSVTVIECEVFRDIGDNYRIKDSDTVYYDTVYCDIAMGKLL